MISWNLVPRLQLTKRPACTVTKFVSVNFATMSIVYIAIRTLASEIAGVL